jgi:hypothetical protein
VESVHGKLKAKCGSAGTSPSPCLEPRATHRPHFS